MIPFHTNYKSLPDQEEMNRIHNQLITPNKLGAVLKFDDSLCDSPTVFKKDGLYYMLFVRIHKNTETSGYETHIAKSENLVDWEYMYPILRLSESGKWDCAQVGGYVAFQNTRFGGSNELERVNGKNYIVYLGGANNGYEADPLSTGLCRGDDILNTDTLHKIPNPVLTPADADSRKGERRTLYKHCMFVDEELTTGYPYVSAYNAKDETGHESIFLAVSEDGEHWQRYGDRAVLDDTSKRINGDPQILKIDDMYVMAYFVLTKDGITYNTFAASRDLVNWKIWDGEPLVKCEYPWENICAHKNWILKENGKVYHYYCAVNEAGERFIALATS